MQIREARMREGEVQLRAWMVGGLDGDAAAHIELLHAVVPLLRAFFGRRLSNAGADVEDLVQETLLAVHEKRATYDRGRPFTAWLYAIARYRLIDHYRRRRATVSVEDLGEMLAAEDLEEATAARIDVDRLLAGLPPKQSAAIRSTHLDGLSISEAAKDAGIGESDVKVSVHRGLKALAHRLRGGQ
jgi:RNA polymerase sigma-70 factor (ECF subfamily)